MPLLERFRGRRRQEPWTLAGVTRPWAGQRPLFAHISVNRDPATGRLAETGRRLPDEHEPSGMEVRWAPGALDGVLGFGWARRGGADRDRPKRAVRALAVLTARASAEALAALDTAIGRGDHFGWADELVGELGRTSLDPARVVEVGRVLTTECPHRAGVKVGMLLLSAVEPTDADVLTLLGTHEEFTVYAVLALSRGGRAFDRQLFDLARRVDDWGRIHCLRALEGTDDPEIRGWALREGAQGSTMGEEIAFPCACTGRLHEALRQPDIDDALFAGAGDIIGLMARPLGVPGNGLGDYAEADAAVASWLRHLGTRSLSVRWLHVLDLLAERTDLNPDLRVEIETHRSAPEVERIIDDGLEVEDAYLFQCAAEAAERRGMSTFDHWARRIRHDTGPMAGFLLWPLMQAADAGQVDDALDLARSRIDLAALATGPALETDLLPENRTSVPFNIVVEQLRHFPGHGRDFIQAALSSPVVRSRLSALRALCQWSRADWGPEVEVSLLGASQIEPDPWLRRQMERVLDGEAIEGLTLGDVTPWAGAAGASG